MFPKYLTEYHNVKMKSKFKSENGNKNKQKQCTYKRNQEKKKCIEIDIMSAKWPFNICLLILRIRTCEHYNSFKTKYI